LPLPGAKLYLRIHGQGRPLVILHGGPDFDHTYLLPELDGLARVARLIYYDQRGRGRSSAGVAPTDVTIESETQDLERLREHLGLDQIALLGHSWGAVLAMEYAARHPHRVTHLVLLNMAPGSHADRRLFGQRREATEAEALAKMLAIRQTPGWETGDIATEAAYYHEHFRATLRRPGDLERIVSRLRVHFTPAQILTARAIEDRLYEQTWNRPGYDVMARLRGLAAPTLVLHGDYDLMPAECARHAAEAIRGARFALLKDCGHFAYLERPAEVFSEVGALLAP